MNERQLKSFLLAAELKSFSKAAESSFISTSALIGQINLLEKDLGFPLFNRSYHGITLSPSGKVFYSAAKDILDRYETAVRKGRALSISESPSLSVSCPYLQFPEFLTDAYLDCQSRFPMISVSFIHSSFETQFEKILKGQADLSFTAEPDEAFMKGLVFTALAADTYSFCMNPGHPLAKEVKITPAMLSHYRILCGKYDYMKLPFSEQLENYGIHSEQINEEYRMETRLKTMSSNDIFVIHTLWSRPHSDILSVVPSDIPAGNIGFISRGKLTAAAASFVDLCRENIVQSH